MGRTKDTTVLRRYVVGHTGMNVIDTAGRDGRRLADLAEVCRKANYHPALLEALRECVAWMKDGEDAQDWPPCLLEAIELLKEVEGV